MEGGITNFATGHDFVKREGMHVRHRFEGSGVNPNVMSLKCQKGISLKLSNPSTHTIKLLKYHLPVFNMLKCCRIIFFVSVFIFIFFNKIVETRNDHL